jgi:GTPase SAR1 family protein
MAPLYYRDAVGALLVCDLSDKISFNSLNYWVKELDDLIQGNKMQIAVIGNKSDLPSDKRVVKYEMMKRFAEPLKNTVFGECSAKTGEGVREIFQ